MSSLIPSTVRNLFPGALESTYLDVASRGLMPEAAVAIAQDHIRHRILGTADKAKYFEAIETARSLFAELIGANAIEIAITKNVSEGLNIVATGLPWRAGDEVIVCSELEHPNNCYAWRNLERLGVKVVDVPSDKGLMPIEAIVARLSARTRVVAVSSVTFRPGFRTDLASLGSACRKSGTLLVVDGAQSVGITHIDVRDSDIDVLAVSCQKGLCSLYGMGFLYVRQKVAQAMSPAYLARFSVDIEKTHEADYDSGPIRYRQAALRFDVGNYNFLAAELTVNALTTLLGVGTKAIDAHVTRLAGALSDRLRHLGAELIAAPPEAIANMVCVDLTQAALMARGKEVQSGLKAMSVAAAVRGKFARFSFHLYNDDQDVALAADAMKTFL
jgi:cysteine desulfurase/selenocysteine lyase